MEPKTQLYSIDSLCVPIGHNIHLTAPPGSGDLRLKSGSVEKHEQRTVISGAPSFVTDTKFFNKISWHQQCQQSLLWSSGAVMLEIPLLR